MIETGVLVWKTENMMPYQSILIYFGSNMPKVKWWIHVSYGFSSNECQTMPRVYVGRRTKSWGDRFYMLPKKHCGTKSARIARPNTLTDSYTRFLLKTQPFLTFVTRTPKCFSYIPTLPKYTVLIHWWIVYANLWLCWSTPCSITLPSKTPTKSHCWAIPNPKLLLRYTLSYYSAKQIQISIHGWAMPKRNN